MGAGASAISKKAAPASEAEPRRVPITTIRQLVRALKIYQHRATGELLLLVDTELKDAPLLVPKPSEWQRMSVGQAQQTHLNDLDNVLPLTLENVSGKSTPRLLPPLVRSPSSSAAAVVAAATTTAAAVATPAFGAMAPTQSPRAPLPAGSSSGSAHMGRGLGTQTIAQVVRGMKCYQHQSSAEILLLVDVEMKDVGGGVKPADWKRVHMAAQPQQAHLGTLDGGAAAAASPAVVPASASTSKSAVAAPLQSPSTMLSTMPSTIPRGAPSSGGNRRPTMENLPVAKSPRMLPPIASKTAAAAATAAVGGIGAVSGAASLSPRALGRPVLQIRIPDSERAPLPTSDPADSLIMVAAISHLRGAARAAPTVGKPSDRGDHSDRRSSNSNSSKHGSAGSSFLSTLSTPPSGNSNAGTARARAGAPHQPPTAADSIVAAAMAVDATVRTAVVAGQASGTFTCTCGYAVEHADEAAREEFEGHMRQCVAHGRLSERFSNVNAALIQAAVVVKQALKREKVHAKADAAAARERRGARCRCGPHSFVHTSPPGPLPHPYTPIPLYTPLPLGLSLTHTLPFLCTHLSPWASPSPIHTSPPGPLPHPRLSSWLWGAVQVGGGLAAAGRSVRAGRAGRGHVGVPGRRADGFPGALSPNHPYHTHHTPTLISPHNTHVLPCQARVAETAARRGHALSNAAAGTAGTAGAGGAGGAGGEGTAATAAVTPARGSTLAAALLDEDRLLAATMAGALEQLRAKRRALREHRRLALGPRDFELVSLLSAGGFGHVFLARRVDTGQHVALKVRAQVVGARAWITHIGPISPLPCELSWTRCVCVLWVDPPGSPIHALATTVSHPIPHFLRA